MFQYVISDILNYAKLICSDAGPKYAESMGWDWVTLSEITFYNPEVVYVIDNRISDTECAGLTDVLKNNPRVKFLVKIVDPSFSNRLHFYYKWLEEVVQFENVYLLSVYQPRELTLFLSALYGKRFLHIPYSYIKENEIPLVRLRKRKNQILISGAVNKDIYPYRFKIWNNITRSVSRLFFHILRHPGYPEMENSVFRHSIIASKYIAYLSNFKFMLLCASNMKIELLKFNECAYAGCLPVGEAPDSYPADIRELFFYLNPRQIFISLVPFLLRWNSSEHITKIEKYRKFLHATRNPEELNKSLLNQIAFESPIYTS